MNGYTKGPWKASFEIQSDGSVEAFHITDSCGDSLLGACSCCNGTYVQGDGKANANLIAAAPDLLEAAEKVIEMNRQHSEDQYGDPEKAEGWACVVILRAAIAKSRGEA